jgi:putative membrane protein
MLDAILAWIHFMLIFALSGTLFAEFFFYQRSLTATTLLRLQRVDAAFGILAGLVIVSGILRVIYSPKTPAYFLHDSFFWTKMVLYVTVGLISIAPTRHYLSLRSAPVVGGIVTIPENGYAATRRWLTLEVVLLLFIPLCASLMAHGYGYHAP